MTKGEFDRDRANEEVNHTILRVVDGELPDLKKRITNMCMELQRAKYIVYAQSLALFTVGLFFLILAIATGIGAGKLDETLGTLGFGAAGGTTFVALLLLQPIKKIQKVNSDAGQAEMIYQQWHLGILLYIRAMDITDRESIKEAAKNIRNHTTSAIRMLEKYTEGEKEDNQ